MELSVTFFYTIINFIILLFFLKKFLFKPVTEYMERRRKYIEEQIRQAEEDNKEAAVLRDKYITSMKNAKKEAEELIEKAVRQGEGTKEEIIEQAKKESQKLLERAKREISLEKARVMEELKSETAALALMAASRILEKDVDEDTHDKLVKKFIDEVGELQ
jgi:F-type H+-transporting ATPase subunit b